MRRALLLIILSLPLACAPAQVSMAGHEGTTEPLCWWRNARWDDRGTLLVRGTRIPLARAHARWAGAVWGGANTTGVLRRTGDSVMLEGEWTGPGLTLRADVDVAAHAVFRVFEPRRIGAAGLLLKGAHVRLKDALVGRALVVPSDDALRPFRTEEQVAADLSCDGLSLSATPPGSGDPARALLAQAGFPQGAPEKWLPQNASLPAAERASGPTMGFFVAESAPVRGFVVEQRESEARLVVPTAEGVVWVGWVDAAPLRDPGPAPAAVVAKQAPAEVHEWRQCEGRELPLLLGVQGRLIELGTLRAGTPFAAGARDGAHREVTLALDWLDLSPRLRVLVPAEAIDCPRLKKPEW